MQEHLPPLILLLYSCGFWDFQENTHIFGDTEGQLLEAPPSRDGEESLPKGRFLGTREHWAAPKSLLGNRESGQGQGMSEVTQK